MDRRDKINYYLDIAQTVAERSTCLRRYLSGLPMELKMVF